MDSQHEQEILKINTKENSITDDNFNVSCENESLISKNGFKLSGLQNDYERCLSNTNIVSSAKNNVDQDGYDYTSNEHERCEHEEIEDVIRTLLDNAAEDTISRFLEEEDGWSKCYEHLSKLKLRLHHLNSLQASINAESLEEHPNENSSQKNKIEKQNSRNGFEAKPTTETELVEVQRRMLSLLQLYLNLPVTVDMMKTNSAAKNIKHLIKSQHHGISSISKEIIDKWMSQLSRSKSKEVKKHKSQHFCNSNNKTESKKLNNHNNNNSINTITATTTITINNNNNNNNIPIHHNNQLSPTSPAQNKPNHMITSPTTPTAPVPLKNGKESKGFMDALTSSVTNTTPKPRKRNTSNPRNSIFKGSNTTNNNNNNNGDDYYVVDGEVVSGRESVKEQDNSSNDKEGPTEKRVKKEVRFADDLCSYFYFVVDESERVNRMMDFVDVRRHEIEMEYQMFQNNRKQLFGEAAVDKQHWRRPMHISNVQQLAEWGCQSVERKIQLAREQNVLQVIYFNKDMVPDFPEEADPEFQPITDPKTIPLSDITGVNSEVLYEHTTSACTASTTTSNTCTFPSILPMQALSSHSHLTDGNNHPANGRLVNNHHDLTNDPTSSLSSSVPSLSSPPPVNTPWTSIYPMMPVMMDSIRPPLMLPAMFVPSFPPPPHLFNQPSPNQGNKPLCTHFLSGTCKFGNNCRNFHPSFSPVCPSTTHPLNNQLLPPNHTSTITTSTNHTFNNHTTTNHTSTTHTSTNHTSANHTSIKQHRNTDSSASPDLTT